MITLHFTPAEDSTNEPLEMGPFSDVYVEDANLYADGERVAWVFVEGAADMMNPANLFGHPDAGKWVITATERLYGRCTIDAGREAIS